MTNYLLMFLSFTHRRQDLRWQLCHNLYAVITCQAIGMPLACPPQTRTMLHSDAKTLFPAARRTTI